MTSFDFDLEACNVEDFSAEATPQAGSLEEAASTQEILIQQIEGYLNRMRSAICADVQNLKEQIDACDCSGGGGGAALPSLVEGVETSSGRQIDGNDTFFKLLDIGTLPNTTTTTTAHGIGAAFALVQAYGVGNDPGTPNSIPLIFATTGAASNTVWFFTDATNVNVVAGSNRTAFTNNYVVLEYYYL